jgi:hypothetical protein
MLASWGAMEAFYLATTIGVNPMITIHMSPCIQIKSFLNLCLLNYNKIKPY